MKGLNQDQEKWMSPSAFKQDYRGHFAWRQMSKLRELRDVIAKLPERLVPERPAEFRQLLFGLNLLNGVSKSLSGKPQMKFDEQVPGQSYFVGPP